jgi:hypothetical protein
MSVLIPRAISTGGNEWNRLICERNSVICVSEKRSFNAGEVCSPFAYNSRIPSREFGYDPFFISGSSSISNVLKPSSGNRLANLLMPTCATKPSVSYVNGTLITSLLSRSRTSLWHLRILAALELLWEQRAKRSWGMQWMHF